MNSRVKFFVVFFSTSLAALLLVGAVIGKSASPDGPYHHLAVYTEVLSRIKSEYVEEPDMKSVTLGALNGLLESIDPFASYLNADQYKEYLKKKDAYKGDVGLVLLAEAHAREEVPEDLLEVVYEEAEVGEPRPDLILQLGHGDVGSGGHVGKHRGDLSADTRHHRHLIDRDREGDVLEIIDARAADFDCIFQHGFSLNEDAQRRF